MSRVVFNHLMECYLSVLKILPGVTERGLINRLNQLHQMQVIIFPQLNQVVPIGMLLILQSNP